MDKDNKEHVLHVDMPVEAWCKCGKCGLMSTELENSCCHELESAHIFDLEGFGRV